MSMQPLTSTETGSASSSQPSISQTIASFASALEFDAIPEQVRNCAKHHILDVVGTALAATRFDFGQHALAGLLGIAEGGRSSVIGMGIKLPLRDAALLNGILANGLDFDDTHTAAIVHPACRPFAIT